MGFKDFLVKIGIAEKAEEELQVSREIQLKEVEVWVKEEEEYTKEKAKEIFREISSTVDSFTEEIAKLNEVLKSVDVDSKKDEDRIKLIVKENRENYCAVVSEFLESLNKLEINNFQSFINASHKVFENFNRKSNTNYQKTTLLIGKEIAAVRDKIRELSKYLNQTFESNKWLINSTKDLEAVKSKLSELKNIDSSAQKMDEEIKSISNKIIDLEDKMKNTKEEISKIKLTSDYIENQKAKEEIQQIKNEVEEEISLLRSIIDFRALTNFYHISEKEMKILNEYKENFSSAFEKTNGAEILRLLNESKLSIDEIKNKHGFILDLKKKSEDLQASLKKDMTEFLDVNISEMNTEVENLDAEKQKQSESYEKIISKKQDLIIEIKSNLENFGIFLVE